MIKAVLFDIDGTLVDYLGAQRRALQAVFRTLDELSGVDFEEFAAVWNDLAERYMREYLAGALTFAEQRVVRVREAFALAGRPVSATRAQEIFRHYLTAYERSWRLYDDVQPCLRSLHRFRLGVISNGDPEQQRRKLSATGLEQRFSVVVVSGDMGTTKPDPAIFHQAAERLRVSPVETAYVGDSLEVDALGARAAGMLGIWLNRAGDPTPPGGQTVLQAESLLSVPALVGRERIA